jgi:hypothetical protein
VYAWERALAEAGLPYGGLAHPSQDRDVRRASHARRRAEIGRPLSDDEAESLQRRDGEIFHELEPTRRPGRPRLPGRLRNDGITHGIATPGRLPELSRDTVAGAAT